MGDAVSIEEAQVLISETGAGQAAASVEHVGAVLKDLRSVLPGAAIANDVRKISDEATKAEKSLKQLKLEANRAKIRDQKSGMFDQFNKLPAALSSSPKPVESGFGKIAQLIGDNFGGEAAGQFIQAGEGLAKAGEMLKAAGPFVAAAAVALAVVVAALYKVASEVVTRSIAATERKQGAVRAFGGGAGGEQLYQGIVKQSISFGLDQAGLDEQIQKAKTLTALGFSKTQIPLVLKAEADVGALFGPEKAAALQEAIQKVTAKGKFDDAAFKGLETAGLKAELIYKNLAVQLGITAKQAQDKVKAGTISTTEAIKAITATAEQETGGAAAAKGRSITGLLAGIQLQASTLFDNVNTGPMTEALTSLLGTLDGPAGAGLKSACTDLGNAVFDALFGGLQGASGAEKITEGIKEITGAVRGLQSTFVAMKPAISAFYALVTSTGFEVALVAGLAAIGVVLAVLLVPLGIIAAPFILLGVVVQGVCDIASGFADSFSGIGDSLASAATWCGSLLGDFLSLGADICMGMAEGVAGAAGALWDAVKNAVLGALGAGRTAADAHSPSRKAAALIGRPFSQGMAVGVRDAAGDAASASMDAVGGMLRAASKVPANDNGGVAPGSARPDAVGGSGVTVHYAPTFTLPAHSTPEQARAAVQSAHEADQEAFERKLAIALSRVRRAA